MTNSSSDSKIPEKLCAFYFTAPGCGNHLVGDLMRYIGYTKIPHHVLNFWPTYVVAKYSSESRTFLPPYSGTFAEEAIRSYYHDQQFQYDSTFLEFGSASKLFKAMISQLEAHRLFVVNYFHYTFSRTQNL